MAKGSWRLGDKGDSWRLPLAGSKAAEETGVSEAVVRRMGAEFGVFIGRELVYSTNTVARAKAWAETYRVRGAEGMLQWR